MASSLRVVVLTGGSTPERRVALAGAGQVVAALRSLGHEVQVVDTVRGPIHPDEEANLLSELVGAVPPTKEELGEWKQREQSSNFLNLPSLRQCDLVFLVLHGRMGEGGLVQAVLESRGIRFTGSNYVGSALAMDKELSKQLFKVNGIPTPDWLVWPAPEAQIDEMGYPLIVKPSYGGSSVSLSLVYSYVELCKNISDHFRFR